MTFKQLEYALAITKYGSLSQAAENLYISQPTLSEAIQKMCIRDRCYRLLISHKRYIKP